MKPAEYLKQPYSRVVVPESDGTFRGEVLEFPGCLATGETAAEALASLEEVAASWLESMLARNQAIPKPQETSEYSGKLVLRLPKSLHRNAAIAARREGVSLNSFIANCVAECVGATNYQRVPLRYVVHNNVVHMYLTGPELTTRPSSFRTNPAVPFGERQIATSDEKIVKLSPPSNKQEAYA